MYGVNRLHLFCGTAALTLAMLSGAPATAAAYAPVYDFAGADGQQPNGELVTDGQRRLYGTTAFGGAHSGGTVFRLTKSGKNWTQEVLFDFPAGQNPRGGVTHGQAIFGVTQAGGAFGQGSVWRLDANGTLTTLHDFNPTGGQDGFFPEAGLVLARDGMLYGTTAGQQPQDGSVPGPNVIYGTVFRVSQDGDPSKYAVLHVFGAAGDGQTPGHGRFFVNSGGVLTGTTSLGGTDNEGTVYQLSPPRHGQTVWKEKVLRSFSGTGFDAVGPLSGVVRGLDGKFYGCAAGGHNGNGAVYAVDAAGNEQVIYNFGDQANDPAAASSCAVTVDPAGTLYGTSTGGGANANKGTLFRVAPDGAGGWTETVLHSFGGSGDGQIPNYAPLRRGKVLYGTAPAGGAHGDGMVFSLKP